MIAIGKRAFSYNKIQHVTIPDTVKRIEDYAFVRNSLTNIQFPSRIQEIGRGAFLGNHFTSIVIPESLEHISPEIFRVNYLKQITFHDNIQTIGYDAFSNNSLETIRIPANIQTIGTNAFYRNRIKNLTLEEGVQTIGAAAFSENLLRQVMIPQNVQTISRGAFFNNPLAVVEVKNIEVDILDSSFGELQLHNNGDKLTNLADGDGVFENAFIYGVEGDTVTIKGYIGDSKNVDIPATIEGKTVTAIGDKAFYKQELQGVTLPDTIETIGKEAFSTNNLSEITIPSKVTIIALRAFYDNRLESLTIPENVREIGFESFGGFRYSKLKNLTLADGLEKIGGSAFERQSLQTVIIPDSVREIESSAFYNNQIESVKLSNNLETIENNVFSNNRIEQIIIPAHINRIKSNAFNSNPLTTAIVKNINAEIEQRAFGHLSLNGIYRATLRDVYETILRLHEPNYTDTSWGQFQTKVAPLMAKAKVIVEDPDTPVTDEILKGEINTLRTALSILKPVLSAYTISIDRPDNVLAGREETKDQGFKIVDAHNIVYFYDADNAGTEHSFSVLEITKRLVLTPKHDDWHIKTLYGRDFAREDVERVEGQQFTDQNDNPVVLPYILMPDGTHSGAYNAAELDQNTDGRTQFDRISALTLPQNGTSGHLTVYPNDQMIEDLYVTGHLMLSDRLVTTPPSDSTDHVYLRLVGVDKVPPVVNVDQSRQQIEQMGPITADNIESLIDQVVVTDNVNSPTYLKANNKIQVSVIDGEQTEHTLSDYKALLASSDYTVPNTVSIVVQATDEAGNTTEKVTVGDYAVVSLKQLLDQAEAAIAEAEAKQQEAENTLTMSPMIS